MVFSGWSFQFLVGHAKVVPGGTSLLPALGWCLLSRQDMGWSKDLPNVGEAGEITSHAPYLPHPYGVISAGN